MDLVVAWARANGMNRLLLDVADLNAQAIALYESKGFKPNGKSGSCHRLDNTSANTSANCDLRERSTAVQRLLQGVLSVLSLSNINSLRSFPV